MSKSVRLVLAVLIVAAFPLGALAEDEPGENEHGKITAGSGAAVGGACIGAGLAAIGGGYAIARVGGHCIESMARQPEAAGSMFAPMIVTAAMIEGAMLFAIAVALLAVLKTL
ncbi:MAG: ATP synthase F0 subunit C [Phycisphaerae bacterium]|nr:ATP synthase F0 subunit C [Phycisphaerae bacterium]